MTNTKPSNYNKLNVHHDKPNSEVMLWQLANVIVEFKHVCHQGVVGNPN